MNDPEDKVNVLLVAIEDEKRKLKPDRRQMRKWFNEIVQLKEDWRTVYTGQENRFLTHTSMRTWRDDA